MLVVDRLEQKPLPSWFPSALHSLSSVQLILFLCCLYVSIAALAAVFRYYWRVHIVWSVFPLFHRVRTRLFQHILSLDWLFLKKRRVGDFISAVSEDSDNIRMTTSLGTLAVIDTFFSFVLFVPILFFLSPQLSWVIIPFLVLSSLSLVLLSDRLTVLYEKVQEIIGDLSGSAFEISSGARVIKAFGKEKEVHKNFVDQSKKLQKSSMQLATYESLFFPILTGALGLAMGLTLLWGGYRVIQGEMELSKLIAYQLYLGYLDWPMLAMGWFIGMYRRSRGSLQRLQKIDQVKSGLQPLQGLPTGGSATSVLSVENLGYEYSVGMPALEGLSFDLLPGEWVGLTGPIAGGKTTLLELLSRQKDPSSGEVYFKTENLKSFSTDELSQKVLYLPQEAYLFSKSVRDNIHLGLAQNARWPDQQIWELLEALQFDTQLLKNRGGLWLRLGERGTNFSGGQKQRVAIARSLVRDRDLYLFDDAFSQLDAETEYRIFSWLKTRLARSSVLFVSQRLQSLRMCDKVIVLNEGRIEFQGPVGEGLKSSSFLKELERLQRLGQEQVS